MSKNAKSIVIMAVVLVVLIGFYAAVTIIKNVNAEKKAAEYEASIAHLGSITDPVKISVANADGTFSYHKDGDSWYWDDDADYVIDPLSIDTICTIMTGMTAEAGFLPSESLSAYGFDNPNTVTITDANGSVFTLSVGKSTSNDSCYIMQENDDKIYLANDSLRLQAKKDILDVIKKDTVPSIPTENLVSVTLEQGDKKLELAQFVVSSKSGEPLEYKWFCYLNGSDDAMVVEEDQLTAVQTLTTYLAGSPTFYECVKYKTDETDLRNYGLSPADLTMTVRYTDSISNEEEEYTICLGGITQESQYRYYAKLGSSQSVYSIYSSPRAYMTNVIESYFAEDAQ